MKNNELTAIRLHKHIKSPLIRPAGISNRH
jgi:hypothetical protein